MKTPKLFDSFLIGSLIGYFLTLIICYSYLIGVESMPIDTTPIIHHVKTTPEMIVTLAQNNNFNVATAIRIADCESKLGKYKTNWEGSSAKGVFMFTDKTWKNYCTGDVMNNYDNIMCFIKMYKQHPSWWKCK